MSKIEGEKNSGPKRSRKRLSSSDLKYLPSIDSKKEKEIKERRTSFRQPRGTESKTYISETAISEPQSDAPLKCKQKLKKFLLNHWQGLSTMLVFFIIILRISVWPDRLERRIWCIILLVFFWSTEVVPYSIAGLIPIALFPLLDVISSESIAVEYLSENTVLMLCAYIVSAVIESTKLHKMIAVRLLLIVGFRVRIVHMVLMLGVFIIGIIAEETFVGSLFGSITRAVLIIMEEEEICTMYDRMEGDE